ncbi:hypothetical protein LMG19146_02750 [Xanthomonas arboricola pv. fragariae]|nr:hypothetical protein LMG19146_02750 [Xanthomonas arboricola pv. fragariae]
MPRQSLHGRTCGVSHAGTRASARSRPTHSRGTPDVVRKIDRRAGSVGGAAPHPVSGHAVNPSLEARWRHPCRHTVPPPDAAPRSRYFYCWSVSNAFKARAAAYAVCGQCKSVSHLSAATSPAMVTLRRPSAFLSATDNNRWCLRAWRCGTLSGMDAAPEPTWTYLRRVPHRYACKRPRQTRALAWKRPGVGHRVIGVRSRSAARRRIQCRDTP